MPTETVTRAIGRPGLAALPDLSAAPFQFVLRGTEFLRVNVYTLLQDLTLEVRGRLLTRAGEVQIFSFTLPAKAGSNPKTLDVPLGVGALLNVVARLVDNGPLVQQGECFAQLQLINGQGSAATLDGVLVQSYVTNLMPAAWPGTPIRSPVLGPPCFQVNNFGPAAAGFPGIVAPGGLARLYLVSLWVRLLTSGAVANRRVALDLAPGFTFAVEYMASVTQPASTQWDYYFVAGGPQLDLTAQFAQYIALPLRTVQIQTDNWTVRCYNQDAGDQFTIIRAYRECVLEAS